jgi:hypothetical protein
MLMKKLLFFFVLCALILAGSLAWESKASNESRKQKAVAQFDNPVVLQGVTLKGQYLFVHDDAAMSRGEACTYVYKGTSESAKRLVVSFHCVHVDRTKTDRFILRSLETSPGVIQLREFQFAGDTAGHAVPGALEEHINK